MKPVLSVRKLAARRGRRLLFRDLDFDLYPGEQLRLGGANGSGKTTLLRLLTGLGRPAAGRINRPDAGNMLYLGHRNALKMLLTATENLMFGALGLPVRRARVLQALQESGLAEWAEAPVSHLSAGQQRRLALTRLLLHPASLWVLDEPLSSLDAEAQQFWLKKFRTFAGEGGAVLLTAHAAADEPEQAQKQLELSRPAPAESAPEKQVP